MSSPKSADGVFSGGGIKGLAFAGAVAAAEEAGYVFDGDVAGTSAGAIAALTLALGYGADGLRDLFSGDFSSIDDPILGVFPNYFRHGWVQGKGLTRFIQQIVDHAPVKATTFGDLPAGKLRVIGTDLVHERMVVLPDHAGLYRDPATDRPYTPATFPLALAVRISAGYPGFFPPIMLEDVQSGKDGALVDGGVCSSFPIWLFDQPEPKRPTWGFRLYDGAATESGVLPVPNAPISGPLWPIDLLSDVVDTAISALDTAAMAKFGHRIIAIPTGSISALNFSPSDAEKRMLYDNGYEAAKAFFAGSPVAMNTFGAVPQPRKTARRAARPAAGKTAGKAAAPAKKPAAKKPRPVRPSPMVGETQEPRKPKAAGGEK